MENGYVSPISVREVESPMTAQERDLYDRLTHLIQQAFHFCGPNLQRWRNCYDPKSKRFVGRQAMFALVKRKMLLSGVEAKKKAVYQIVQEHSNERVLLFSESVPAIESIRKFLSENGVKSETYHSRIEPWKRQEILSDWGVNYQVLLSCRALEEGLDVKEVSVGVLIASGRSPRQFIQRIGRVIRPRPGKQAKFYVVYCPNTLEETHSRTIENLITIS